MTQHKQKNNPHKDIEISKTTKNQSEDLVKKVQALENEIQEKNEIAKNSQIAYLHLKSDFDILQRQTQQKLENAEHDALIKVVKKFLPFIEDLRKSLFNINEEQRESPMGKGLEMMYTKILQSLHSLHIEPIESIGLTPDAEVHEPVSLQPTENPKLKGKIIQEFEQGFIYKDKERKIILQPAKVIVGE